MRIKVDKKFHDTFLLMFFLGYSSLVNIILFASNQTRGMVNYIGFFFAIFLPIVGAISFFATKLYGNNLNKILKSVLMDYVPFIFASFSMVFIFSVQLFSVAKVQQSSMLPTLRDGQVIFIEKYNINPKFSDIVIVKTSNKKHPFIVKRVWGTPGDVIDFIKQPDGRYEIVIYKNNQKIRPKISPERDNQKLLCNYAAILKIKGFEDYVEEHNGTGMLVKSIFSKNGGAIPKNYYLVIGDNLAGSHDSRAFGLVHIKSISARKK